MALATRPGRPPARGGSAFTRVTIIVLVLIIIGLLIFIGYTRGPHISGFGPSEITTTTTHFDDQDRVTGVDRAVQTQNPRRVWDWIGLIGISAVIGAVGVYYTYRERKAQEVAENQRAQDEALSDYLDQMSNLIIDHDLRRKGEGSDEWKLAQARTIAVLLGLDKDRKRRILKLLYELGLVSKNARPSLHLKNAGLDRADLSEITLHDACLSGADLRLTDLRGADLASSDLSEADLRGADLSYACLGGAGTSLKGANLLPFKRNPAMFSEHNLNGAAPGRINWRATNLQGADLREADLSDSHLAGAHLRDAKLSRTNLSGADLRGANVKGADLTDANLDGANLEGARGISGKVLERTALSLKGAVMPGGEKHD